MSVLAKMKRERAFLQTTNPAPWKRSKPLAVSVVKPQPKLNRTQAVQVKKLITQNEEKKYFRPGVVAATSSITATLGSMSNVGQGVTDDDRVGNVIAPVYFKIKLDFTMADGTQRMRFIVFRWNENDTYVSPTAAKILSNGPSGAPDVYSYYNDDESQSFKILYDTTVIGVSGASSTTLRVARERKIPLSGKMKFSLDAVSTGTHKLYYLHISDSSAVTHPTVTWFGELCYTDA